MWSWVFTAISGLWGKLTGSSDPISIKLLFILFNSGNITITEIEKKLEDKGKPVNKKSVEAELQQLCSLHYIEKDNDCYSLTTLGREYLSKEIVTILT